MKRLLIILSAVVTITATGQNEKDSLRDIRLSSSANNGRVYVEFGMGMGIQSGFSNVDRASAFGPANAIYRLQVSYLLKKQFSLGLQARSSIYFTTRDTNEVAYNVGSQVLSLNPTYYLVDQPKFNVFIGFGLGPANIESYRELKNGRTEEVYGSGSFVSLAGGLHLLFTRRFGMHMRFNYASYNYVIQSILIDGESRDRIDERYVGTTFFTFRGLDSTIGLTLAF